MNGRHRHIAISREGPEGLEPKYAFATLVTDPGQYRQFRQSFEDAGFSGDCEYLWIDNTGANQTDAYAGLNALLDAARAPIVILCHQDIRRISDDRGVLDQRLAELSRIDPQWALAGNAGGVSPGRLALRISDPHGADQRAGNFPERVASLDENLLIVRRDARLGFSHDLAGFHFYGADICLHAGLMGRTAYVIDFHIAHLSPGKKDAGFAAAEAAFQAKWSNALSPRWLQTTCSLMYLSGSPLSSRLGRLLRMPASKIARRLGSARGWPSDNSKPAWP